MQELLIKVQSDPILSLMLVTSLIISILYVGFHLRLSPVISFLLCGVLVGQYCLNLMPEGLNTQSALGEMAISFLLFVVGLELDSSVMNWKDKKRIFMGIFQVFGAAFLLGGMFYYLDFSIFNSLRLGLLCAMSSTAVVLKVIEERGDSHSPYAINSTTILIIQDFFAVVLMSVMILPAELNSAEDFKDAGFQLFKTIVFVPIIFLAARYLLPRLLRIIVQKNEQELFMFTLLMTVIGSSFIGHYLCGSGAMGAFLAGFALAGSSLAYQIRSDIDPFKQVLLSIFFLMVGASFNPFIFETHWQTILAFLIFIPLFKSITTFISMMLTKNEIINSARTSIALSQIGEFSLLLVVLAHSAKWIDENFMQSIFAVAIASMGLTPLFIKFAQSPFFTNIFKNISKVDKGAIVNPEENIQAVIVGYGIAGMKCAELFDQMGVHYSIIDQNNKTIEKLREKGLRAIFGDAARHDILEASGISEAKWLIIAVPSSVDRLSITCEGRLMNENIQIIVRSHFVKEKTFLEEVGATLVISEEETVSVALVDVLKTKLTLN